MSRYTLLLLLNIPFIIAAILGIVTRYKIGHASKKRFMAQILIWLIILIGLLLAQPAYNWLRANGLTDTDSLSLFDVVQITAIVLLFYLLNQLRSRLETVDNRLQKLHQELSIQISTSNINDRKKN